MDELTKLIVTGASSVSVTTIIWLLVSRIVKEREEEKKARLNKAESQNETSHTKLITELHAELKHIGKEMSDMRTEARVASERYIAVQTALGESRERINGMSASYSKSIQETQMSVVRIETRLGSMQEQLEQLSSRFDNHLSKDNGR